MKLTIRKTLLISLALLAALAMAALAVSFFRVNRTVNISGQFQYRTVTPVVAGESGFVTAIYSESDDKVEENTGILALENEDLESQIDAVTMQIKVLELEIEGIKDQERIDQFSADKNLAALAERIAIATDTEKLRSETHELNRELLRMGRISETAADEFALQARAATFERVELESNLETAYMTQTISQSAHERTLEAKEISLRSASKRHTQLRSRYEDLTIRAPASGILFAKGLDQLSNSFVAKGTKIGEVVSFGEINFIGFANGTDVIRIQEGQKVYFDVDIFRRKVFVQGTVTHVGYEISQDSDYMFPVEIELDNKAFTDRGKELYIQAGVPGTALVVVEENLSLITLVWEKILDFVDFEVYLQ